MLKIGDKAPLFDLPTHQGKSRSLSEYLSEGTALLIFHRGTW